MTQMALIVKNSSFKNVSVNCWPNSLHSQEFTGKNLILISTTSKAEGRVIGGSSFK